MSADALRELSRVLGGAGEQGVSLNARRAEDLTTSQSNLRQVSRAWESPESERLMELAAAYLRRAAATSSGYERGFTAMAEVAQKAGTLAGQLEEAARNEMSLWQRAQSLGESLWRGTVDVVSERDLQAREQAQQQHRRAVSMHDEARRERERLEGEWRLACEQATRAVQAALSIVQGQDIDIPGDLRGRAHNAKYTRQDTQIAWSSYVARVVTGARSPAEIRALWDQMDATERRVLIETHPGLVHNFLRDVVDEDWDALFAEFHAYQISGGSLALSGSAQVDIKVVTVGLDGGVSLSRAELSDGRVNVRLKLDAAVSAGLDIKAIGAHVGRDGEVWAQLSFASIEEYEAFVAEVQRAIEQDSNPWGAGAGESLASRGRRFVTSELASLIHRTVEESLAGVGGEQGAFGKLEASVPNVMSASAALRGGTFHDTVSGHTGVYLSGDLKGAAFSGPGTGLSGGTTAGVEGQMYIDGDDRAFVSLNFDGQMLAGAGVRGDVGTVGASFDSLMTTGAEITWTVEVRPETEPLIQDALAALVPPGNPAAFATSLVELHDASEVTSRQTSGMQNQGKVTGMTGPRGFEGSVTGTHTTTDTDQITRKAPYDQPYTVSVAH